ncbi:outer membrane usher protein FimD [Escherichia coli]|uniref:Outer membrane usher protein FimD n=1 Tax=Escherichia coli TaxID=562 RepID=A0A377D5U1_ECOLX|nr:outer membrane usher protein FimD [Escherichia coli]
MNGDLVDSIVGFAEARKEFHAQLLLNTLTINTAGVVSNADSSNKNSKAIAREIARFLQAETIGELNRPGFPGECFICELRLPDHRFRWKHNKLFLLLPEEYGPAFPAIVDCYTSPPT